MVTSVSRVLVALCAALVCLNAGAAVSVHVDRKTFPVTDSVRATFETDLDVDRQPDFSPLTADFEILGTSRATRVNVINGRVQRSASWTVELMAKHAGTLVIPAVILGNEFTQPVTVNVRKSGMSPGGVPTGDVSLEVEVDEHSPYVQQQMIYTVRVLSRVSFDSASLSEPKVTGGDVNIERLGDDVSYETQRGGEALSVVERRYALFPQESGSITIEPLMFQGRTGGGPGSFFDPFARDARQLRARSEPVSIDVRPIPAGFPGRVWLPAQQLILDESFPDSNSSQTIQVGEAVTRTLTLRAKGLAAAQLPQIDGDVPDGLRRYPDQPALSNDTDARGIVGTRQQKVALIPSRPGPVTLPAVSIPWWNTTTDQLEYARIPARDIEVVPAAPGAVPAPPPQAQPAAPAGATPPETNSATLPGPESATGAASSPPKIWIGVSVLLAIGWLVTAIGWYVSRRRGQRDDRVARPPGRRRLLRDLERHCRAGDAELTRDTLLAWAQQEWPGENIRSLGALAARVDDGLQREIHTLSRTLYRDGGQDWRGAQLWTAIQARGRQGGKSAQHGPQLEPLRLSP